MNIKGKTIWQVAAGNVERNYVDTFLDWDVITVGPGDEGPWDLHKDEYEDCLGHRLFATIERFSEEVSTGDIVVLRLGIDKVHGVGRVEEDPSGKDYLWFDDFGDIDGWSQEHIRRVKWLWKRYDKPATFPKYTLKLGDTVQSVDRSKTDLIRWLEGLKIPLTEYKRDLKPLPPSCKNGEDVEETDLDDIMDFLYDEGISAASIENLFHLMDDLARIARWYDRSEHPPSEEETTSYLVVPLLRALGWTPQKMAIEWNNIDVALFESLPREDENLSTVVEVKKLNDSSRKALNQAKEYANGEDRDSCDRLIITDGLRYSVYNRRKSGKFKKHPDAYLSLIRMRDSYPILHCKSGAKEALKYMAPE